MLALRFRTMLGPFGLLSLADLGMTRYLLATGGRVVEGNPLARWWLESFGWEGLFGFKAATALAACAACLAVARYRPRLGAAALAGSCLILLAVVSWSCSLVRAVTFEDDLDGWRLHDEEARARRLDRKNSSVREFNAKAHRLAKELAAGRHTLADAARELGRHEHLRDPVFVKGLEVAYPGLPAGAREAAILVRATLVVAQGERQDVRRRTATRLVGEFRTSFGYGAPWSVDELLDETCASPEDGLAFAGAAPPTR